MPQHLLTLLSSTLAMPRAAWVLFAACAGALLFALTMQFGFDVQPCVLCLWQRVPFVIGAVLSLLAALWKPYGRRTSILLALAALALLINSGVAFFHTGVELHWWLGTKGCSIQPLHGTSVEDLRTQLLHTVVAHCDQISWTFLGLSMANWNMPLSLSLAVFAFLAARKIIPCRL